MSNTNYDEKLRYAFTKLMTTLWIDRDYIEIVLPNRVRVWNTLEEDSV
jgi:hypothetical protein